MRTRTKGILVSALLVALAVLSVSAYAENNRPYHNGSVWSVNFVRVKPGMDSAYMTYLAGQWKKTQEAAKKDGLVLSYKVLTTEGHGTTDWNMMLMTETKDMATMEANESKLDALEQKMVGDDQKQMQGYTERAEIRELMGTRIAREMLLEPK